MLIKISKGIESAGAFPFGNISSENAQFLLSAVGKTFEATRRNINFYALEHQLPSGRNACVHIYNAVEIC